jgi:hypothetical protein
LAGDFELAAGFDEFGWVLWRSCQGSCGREKREGLTVTTVSLAPASPPARMLVSVEVDCFLSIFVKLFEDLGVFGGKEIP